MTSATDNRTTELLRKLLDKRGADGREVLQRMWKGGRAMSDETTSAECPEHRRVRMGKRWRKEPMPCPCCGSSVSVTYGIGLAGKYAHIRCNCGLQTRPVLGGEREAAKAVLAIWNNRKGCA